jgi:cystathionine beta-lyase family protein involved in aluminum resistance
MSKDTPKEGSKFNETDVFRVRRNSRLNTGIYMCKLILKKHGTIQIEGMGESISLVCKLSQILSKNGLGVMKSITVNNIENDNSRSINPKMTIKLVKSADFDKLTENIVLKE